MCILLAWLESTWPQHVGWLGFAARVQALQTRVHEVHTKLGTAAPQLPPMPAAGGPLMFRVEALEIALDTLLAAEVCVID